MVCLSEDSKENNETNKDVIAILFGDLLITLWFVMIPKNFQVITQINYSFTFSTETKTKIKFCVRTMKNMYTCEFFIQFYT